MIRFLDEADDEIQDAIERYDGLREGLSTRFLDALEAACDRIVRSPEMFPIHQSALRGCATRFVTLKRYPYSVIYEIVESTVAMLAVANHYREPGYWRSKRPGPLG